MCIDFREKKKSSLQCISGFFCLHVNRPFSGFFILQFGAYKFTKVNCFPLIVSCKSQFIKRSKGRSMLSRFKK